MMACCIFGNLPSHNSICKLSLGWASGSSMFYKSVQYYLGVQGRFELLGGPEQDPRVEKRKTKKEM